jgi:hypothetical protein
MDYTAIDGDMADFIAAQAELSTTFVLSELRQYLLNDGHPAGMVESAIRRWRDRWFTAAADGFVLTPEGRQAVSVLAIQR